MGRLGRQASQIGRRCWLHEGDRRSLPGVASELRQSHIGTSQLGAVKGAEVGLLYHDTQTQSTGQGLNSKPARLRPSLDKPALSS